MAAYIGLIRAGVRILLAPHAAPQDHVDHLIEKFSPHYIYGPETDHILPGEKIATQGDYALHQLNPAQDYEIHPDLSLLLTTSGSTGGGSLVRISHENLKSNSRSIIDSLGVCGTDRVITTLPMSYSYGLSIINSHLNVGACLILTEASVVSPVFWQLFKQHKPTTFGGVPYIFEMLKKLRFAKMDLSHLRYITQAGGALGDALEQEFRAVCRQNNIKFIIMYGQTEATARISYLPWAATDTKSGSIGIAIPEGEIWLEDAQGVRITAADVSGELIYSGPNVAHGYAQSHHDLAGGDDNKGILRTGDIATCDQDGYFYIVGRKKRFLKIYGHRVNLDELEQLLNKAGFQSVCVGRDDDLRILTSGGHDRKVVKNYVIQNTSLVPAGFSVSEIDEIPRNDSGKIRYAALNDMIYGSG